jgi:hypothetical protein
MATKKNQNTDLEELSNKQDNLLPQNVKASAAEILEQFEKVDASQMQDLTGDYLELKENSEYNFIATGYGTMTDKTGNQIETVELLDKNNKKLIHSSAVLRGSLRKVTKWPCLVRIITETMTEGKNGRYMNMQVLVIPNTTAS